MKQDRNWARDELEIMRGPFPERPMPMKIFPSQDRTRKRRFSFEGIVATGIAGAIIWFSVLIALTLWR